MAELSGVCDPHMRTQGCLFEYLSSASQCLEPMPQQMSSMVWVSSSGVGDLSEQFQDLFRVQGLSTDVFILLGASDVLHPLGPRV